MAAARIQTFPKPRALSGLSGRGLKSEPPLYGWCSDRVHEHGRIHSWATAGALEFLVGFRLLQQERINGALRAEFLSYHPDDLQTLSDVGPTDLSKMENVRGAPLSVVNDRAPVMLRLSQLLRPHKQLEFQEGPWFPGKPEDSAISFWSALFYGPPGTSKTFLAQAIAGELRWPSYRLVRQIS